MSRPIKSKPRTAKAVKREPMVGICKVIDGVRWHIRPVNAYTIVLKEKGVPIIVPSETRLRRGELNGFYTDEQIVYCKIVPISYRKKK